MTKRAPLLLVVVLLGIVLLVGAIALWRRAKAPGALLKAAETGDTDLLAWALRNGADPNTVSPRDGNTALHVAVENGQPAILEQLLEHGARPEVRNSHGDTPLQLVVREWVSVDKASSASPHHVQASGGPEVALILVEHGARPTREPGECLLHWAASAGRAEAARVLVERGADVHGLNAFGDTPLHCAAGNGYSEIAELLLAKGAEVDARGGGGWTPLHSAAAGAPGESVAGRQVEVLHVLVSRGAEVAARAGDGSTALHVAASFGNGGVVAALIEHGADVNARGDRGRTALHSAADHQRWVGEQAALEVVSILLENGADPGGADEAGRTAFDLARDAAVADALRAHEATD